MLGVRHYGALEEDFVARITPCRAFRKMHQFTLRNLENELEPFLFSKFLIHIHPKAYHSRFLHIERYSFIQRLSIEKRIFYKKFQKLAIFITLKMFSKNLGTKSSISTKKHPFFTFSLRFFSKHTKKLQTTTSGVQKELQLAAKQTLAMPDKPQSPPEKREKRLIFSRFLGSEFIRNLGNDVHDLRD